jgi:hypothetical protein
VKKPGRLSLKNPPVYQSINPVLEALAIKENIDAQRNNCPDNMP